MTFDRPALYQVQMHDGMCLCTLCPHTCKIPLGKQGLCKTRFNDQGILKVTNYGKMVSYAYDPIEKKPLKHFCPGKTIFSLGSSGCNLDCQFCQNHELVQFQGDSSRVTPAFVVSLAKQMDSIGIAFTYNEPTIWYEFVMDVSKLAQEQSLKTVWVTNGYINPEPLEAILPYIDAMNIDLKGFSTDFYRSLCKGSLPPVMNSIKLAHGRTHIELTTLLIDGLNTSDAEIHALCKWIASIDPKIPLHLNRYFPAYKLSVPKTSLDTMKGARDIARQYLDHVHVGNCFLDD